MTSGDVNRLFIDTNVLVYAAVHRSRLHEQARRAVRDLQSSKTELWISRHVLREYVAALTRQQDIAPPLSAGEVISDVRRFEALFHVADDTGIVTERLLTLLSSLSVHGRQIHDANIVATMQAYQIERLLTNNPKDFVRYSEMITIIPLAPGR